VPELQDFGEKIGGARKDIWKARGLSLSDLDEMNIIERQANIRKDNIWPRPNWVQLVSEGTPQCVAYWQNKMRQSIPPTPPSNEEETQNNYIQTLEEIRDAVMSVKNPHEINTFYSNYLKPRFITHKSGSWYVSILPEAEGIITNKVLRAAQSTFTTMEREAKKKLFGISKDQQVYISVKNSLKIYQYDDNKVKFDLAEDKSSKQLRIPNGWGYTFSYFYEDDPMYNTEWDKGSFFVFNENTRKVLTFNLDSREEAEQFIEERATTAQKESDAQKGKAKAGKGKKRKTAFTPPQLQHIKRDGPNYRHLRNAEGEMFLNDLGFRGGEFGNWLTDNDRHASMNMAYDSLMDMARILQIRPNDISLGNTLAIAFGARGRGGTNAGAAHYEPDRQVINLTKMSGAGCLAHEWAHALDHAVGLSCKGVRLASEEKGINIPKSMKNLLHCLQYKTIKGNVISDDLKRSINQISERLLDLIASIKPTDLTEKQAISWENATHAIQYNPSTFTGSEYSSFGTSKAVTHPQLEILSNIRKEASGIVIPKAIKQDISTCAASLSRLERSAEEHNISYTVKTDFYKGSIEFDKIFSRAAHGYYQSTCEMFARAFDCYISDKLKESGCVSDYLTAYADSFKTSNSGKTIAAIPLGDERAEINKCFDALIMELKEMGLLHHYEEQLEQSRPLAMHNPSSFRSMGPKRHERTEQLSFEQMLFNAEQERNSQTGNLTTHDKKLTRQR